MRLVYIGFGWAGGIILSASSGAFTPSVWLVGVLLAAIAFWFTRQLAGYRLLTLTVLVFMLGGLRYTFVPQSSPVAQFNDTGGLTIEGVVIDDPDIRDDRTQFRLRVERLLRGADELNSDGLVLVQVPRSTEVQYGDRIQATGLLITPGEFDAFSYSDYLARRGVFSIMENTAVEVLSSGHGSPFYRALFDLRSRVKDAIGRNLPEPQAGLLTGILLGNERGISPELDEDFAAVGASHIIAISGFNMVIIAGLTMVVLQHLTSRQAVQVSVALAVIAVYTIFAGANAAVVRAAVMSGVLIMGQALKRKTYVPASLAFVALVMSILDPNVLWDVSFQLSFFATLGLALYVDPIQSALDRFLRWLLPSRIAEDTGRFLSEPLVVTLAAQVTTLPLIVLYFSRLSLLAVVVNMLIIPVQTYLLVIGGFATLLVFVSPALAQVFYWMDAVLLSWTIAVVRRFADLSFAEVTYYTGARPIYMYFGVLLSVAAVGAAQPNWWLRLRGFVRHRVVISVTLFSGIALVVLIAASLRSRPDGLLHVWFLDVGHSNGVLVQSPDGAHILIDGGRFPSRLLTSIGDRLPFNDREIELLFITQPDEIDTGALPELLARYDVGAVITNGQSNLSDAQAALDDVLLDETKVAAIAGYTTQLGDGLSVEVLNPQETPTISDNLNDSALVLRLVYNDVSFLITGDLSVDGQVAMLEAGQWPVASVMQLPQHGTVRSLDEGFLQAVQPQVIVIQTDSTNRRGDPNPDLLAALPNVPILRTDEIGIIHLWSDGQRLWYEN